jgi:ech hydrogenase subunit D
MTHEQTIEIVTIDALLDKVRAMRQQAFRLVQISATRFPDQVELTYSFDLDGRLASLRVSLPPMETRVPSISSIYGCAILYENEIHDLFDVKVEGMTVDFHGNLYKTSVPFPFGRVKTPSAAPPSGATTPPAAAAASQ